MAAMLRRALRLLLVASVLYGTGAHWAALQSYAWATMRLAKQADPCHVCDIVEKGTSSEVPLHRASAPSVDFAAPSPSFEAVELPLISRSLPSSVVVPSPSFPPPTPPPDAFLA